MIMLVMVIAMITKIMMVLSMRIFVMMICDDNNDDIDYDDDDGDDDDNMCDGDHQQKERVGRQAALAGRLPK